MNLRLKRTPGIYLVGFMASGKSTVGRHLAQGDAVRLTAQVKDHQGPLPGCRGLGFQSGNALVARNATADQTMQQQPVADDGDGADQGRVPPRNPRQRQRAETQRDMQELSQRLVRLVWLNR